MNANVAKVVLESRLGTPTTLLDIDENATWPGLDAGDIDAVLEVWPSGHAEDYETYITGKKTIVDIGPLGPSAKIGWYVPTAVLADNPELATWEGFKDPETASLFATAESGDLGQFLMGDPSYVSYDEQIIAHLTAAEVRRGRFRGGADHGDPASGGRRDAAVAAVLAAALAPVAGRSDRGGAPGSHRRVPGVGGRR